MMRMRNMSNGLSPMNGESSAGDGGIESTAAAATATAAAEEWEMRPGGMLVQRRSSAESDRNSVPTPTIRVRVKYGLIYHQLNISSQATFGELKKMLSGPTGLHHQDQKLFYREKERDSNAFLDMVGVKNKSKIVLQEDPISQEKRFLEMRKNAKMEKAAKSISQISLEVDRLASQVSALESIINKGKKVAESDLISLIEQLMNQLLKLDGMMVDGDVKLQRKMQVRRVQKYVETLDMLKIKNSMMPSSNIGGHNHTTHTPQRQRQEQEAQSNTNRHRSLGLILVEEPQKLPNKRYSNNGRSSRDSNSGVVVTTKWETFDSTTSTTNNNNNRNDFNNAVYPRFNWEFFK